MVFLWMVPVLVFAGCSTKPVSEPKIDFDQYTVAAPSSAHCPDQERVLDQAEKLLADKDYSRALHMAAQIIEAPCSQENYTKALQTAGDVFAARKEDSQAFYFYLEGMGHATDAHENQGFLERILAVTARMPSEKIIALVDGAGAQDNDHTGRILYGAGVAKFEGQDKEGAAKLLQEIVARFAGTPEARQAAAMLERMQKTTKFHHRRIGVMLPLSGFYQAAGERALNGIQMAVDAVNQSGKSSFTLLVRDTRSDPAGAAAAVRYLEKNRAACIIGPMVTGEPAAVQAQALEIPMITLSQQAGIPETGEYIFRNFLTPGSQTRALVSHVMDDLGYERFAVLSPDDRYGQYCSAAFLQAVKDHGGRVTAQAVYGPDQTDYSAQILPFIKGYKKLNARRQFVDMAPGEKRQRNRIYRAKVDFDALFIPDSPLKASQIALQLKYHGIGDVVLLGTNIWNSDTFFDAVGDYPPHTVFPVDFYADSPAEKVQGFVAAYEEMFGALPDYFAAIAYDTANLVMHCLSRPEVTSPSQFVQTLKTLRYDNSVTSPTSFDKTGECIKPLHLLGFTN